MNMFRAGGISGKTRRATSSLCPLLSRCAGAQGSGGIRGGRPGTKTTTPGRWIGAAVLLVVGTLAPVATAASAGRDVAGTVATYLVENQIRSGARIGMWPAEPSFAGSSTAGMVCAYEWIGEPAYLQAAKWGGDYILWIGESTGHLLGDEAYALTCLSDLSEDLQGNPWRVALSEFYSDLRQRGSGSTAEYIDLIAQGDPSNIVFYIAHHTVAAYYVDDADKEIWRKALIRCLAAVDDRSSFPVQALGVATWALAKTGALGDAVIDSSDSGSYWSGVALKDLPGLLLSHQIPEGEPFAGSFYWRFDHGAAGIDALTGGWTEDAVFCTLGLVAASEQSEELVGELDPAIEAAYAALLAAGNAEGKVFEHLSGMGVNYYTYAGELLQVLWNVQQHLDARAEPTVTADAAALP